MRKLFVSLTIKEDRIHTAVVALSAILLTLFLAPNVTFWIGLMYLIPFIIVVSIITRIIILWVRP